MKIIAMIPARLGSQRLKQKNLRQINGIPLIVHAIRKCLKIKAFHEVWVNSESEQIGAFAKEEGANFYERKKELANNEATSEDFVYDFLKQIPCDYLFQVHSIAPLLSEKEIENFVQAMLNSSDDVLLSCVYEQIECAYHDQPINFSLDKKQNSQELDPIQRITWSITGWKSAAFIKAYENRGCATYAGKIGFYPISKNAGHIIKTEEDLMVAQAMMEPK